MQYLPGVSGEPIQNADGTISTEKTIGVEVDGREYVIPTILNGKKVSAKRAKQAAKATGWENYPSFATRKEAEEFAANRSQMLGEAGPDNVVPRGTAPTKDEAKAFVSERVKQARKLIQEIKREYGRDQGRWPRKAADAVQEAKTIIAEHTIGLLIAKHKRGDKITKVDQTRYIAAKKLLEQRTQQQQAGDQLSQANAPIP